MTEYSPIPQPEEIDIREKEDAMGSYFMMFGALAAGLPLPILNLVAAAVYHVLNRKKSRFVHFHTLQSLLSQIPVTLLNAAAVIWFAVIAFKFDFQFSDTYFGYIIMVGIANIVYIIFSVIAAVRARRGQFFYFLFFGKVAYHEAYLIRSENEAKVINKPPSY